MSAKMKIPNGLPIAIANGHVHCPLPMQFVMLHHCFLYSFLDVVVVVCVWWHPCFSVVFDDVPLDHQLWLLIVPVRFSNGFLAFAWHSCPNHLINIHSSMGKCGWECHSVFHGEMVLLLHCCNTFPFLNKKGPSNQLHRNLQCRAWPKEFTV